MLPAIASLEHCCQRMPCHLGAPSTSTSGQRSWRTPGPSRREESNLCAQPVRPTCAPDLCAQPVRPTCVCVPFAECLFVICAQCDATRKLHATLHASYMRRYTRRHTQRHTRRHTRRHARRHTQRHTRATSNSRGCHTARRPFPVTIPTHPQRPSPIVGGFYAEVALQKREAEAQ